MISHRRSAGAIVVGPRGLVVVVNQDNVSWSLPKGGIEAGEDPKAAARREIKEETGLTGIAFINELGTYQRYQISADGKGENISSLRIITLFLCSTSEKGLKPEDPANPEARWVEPDKVADLLTHPEDKKFYLSVLPEVREFIKSVKNL